MVRVEKLENENTVGLRRHVKEIAPQPQRKHWQDSEEVDSNRLNQA